MTIAEKLLTITDNTPAVAEVVNAARTTVTDTTIRVDDVMGKEHLLSVQLKSKNMIETASVDAESDKNKVLFEGSVTGDFVFSCLYNYTECKTPAAAQFEFTVDGVVQYLARGTETNRLSKKVSGTLTKIVYLNWGYGVGTVENLQLEAGTTATEYTPYVADFTGKEVKVYGKNLFKIDSREVMDYGALANTTLRNFTENSVYLNVSANNYCNAGHKMRYEQISDSSFTVLTPSNSAGGWDAYGAAFNFRVKPGTAYSVSASFDDTKGKILGVGFFDETGKYISSTLSTQNVKTPNQCVWMNVIFGVRVRDEAVLYENVMLEIGSTATEYTSYKEPQTATADASGKAEGLRSVYPTMTLASDAFVECAYFPLSSALKYEKYQQLKQAEKDLKESITQ